MTPGVSLAPRRPPWRRGKPHHDHGRPRATASRWPAWVVPALLTLAAGVLRFTDLDYLGFRIDEGFTMTYARQPWRGVLGLDGFYSPHSPLFFALAKLADVFVREEVASRTVAAVAGTATIPVLYALVARLLDRRAAAAAGLLVVLSPLHIQFSRDGRMYAPVVLLVITSYLALLAHWQTPRRRWATLYAASLGLAVYVDYSAAFALAPQAVLLVWLGRHNLRRMRWIVIAGLVGVAAYLPWLPQIALTILRSRNATARSDYLAADWERIWIAIPELFGLDARAFWRSGGNPSPWDRWPDWRLLLLAGLLPAAVVGVLALRRRPLPLAAAGLITLGIPLVSIASSLISPGFAARTVLTSVLGWSIIAGAVFVRGQLPVAVRLFGGAGWVYLVVVSLLALPATYQEGRREQWREVSAELVRQAPLGKPIVIFSTAGMVTDLIDLYAGDELAGARFVTLLDGERETWTGAERWLPRGTTLAQIRGGALDGLFPPEEPSVDAFWMIRRFGGQELDGWFRGLGYQPISVLLYVGIKLELWAREGAVFGGPIPVADLGNEEAWHLGGDTTLLRPPGAEGGTIQLDEDHARAAFAVAGGAGLYAVESRVQVEGPGTGRLSLKCLAADEAVLWQYTVAAQPDPAETGYRSIAAAVVCPEGTAEVVVILDRRGEGGVRFQKVRLQHGSPAVWTG